MYYLCKLGRERGGGRLYCTNGTGIDEVLTHAYGVSKLKYSTNRCTGHTYAEFAGVSGGVTAGTP